MTPAEMTEISNDQLDGLVGAPGEMEGEMMDELRGMWTAIKEDLVKDWPVAEARKADELRRLLHRQRGMVATWGLAGVAAGMMLVEKAEDAEGMWRELGPRLAGALPEVFAKVEARHPGLRGN